MTTDSEARSASEADTRETPASKKLNKLGAKLPKKVAQLQIDIPELKLGILTLTLKGTTPLIMHKFSVKSREQMGKKQQGQAQHKKAPKVPTDCFLESLYTLDGKMPKLVKKNDNYYAAGKFGFPAGGFKKAAVSAADQTGLRATTVNKAFHVIGDLIEIKSQPPVMREDIVRIGGMTKVADLRYRGEFRDWNATLTIRYNANVITPGQIANLFNVAGFAVGIGEWRPQRSGSSGMFEVATKG